MYRELLTNKWVLSGIGFLIVLSVACVLWYQQDTAAFRQTVVDTEKLHLQPEIPNKNDFQTENTSNLSVESTEPTTEKPITQITDKVAETSTPSVESLPNSTQKTQNQEKIATVSPHGFGPYPEVPEDYLAKHGMPAWESAALTGMPPLPPHLELLQRVMIKLWKDGDKQWTGATTGKNGKIYVQYPNRAYVRYKTRQYPDGTKRREIAQWQSGGMPQPRNNEIPSTMEIIDLDSQDAGLDPYTILGINKGEQND